MRIALNVVLGFSPTVDDINLSHYLKDPKLWELYSYIRFISSTVSVPVGVPRDHKQRS